MTFLGPRDDVPDLLCAADAVVIPSRWEGLSNVLIEAMALEAPVVASDLPTLEDAASDGETAILVPPADPARLAPAIVATLADPEAARRRAGRARAVPAALHRRPRGRPDARLLRPGPGAPLGQAVPEVEDPTAHAGGDQPGPVDPVGGAEAVLVGLGAPEEVEHPRPASPASRMASATSTVPRLASAHSGSQPVW